MMSFLTPLALLHIELLLVPTVQKLTDGWVVWFVLMDAGGPESHVSKSSMRLAYSCCKAIIQTKVAMLNDHK